MISGIKALNLPDNIKLAEVTVNLPDMGEKTITSQVKFEGAEPLSSEPWAVEFRGEKYIMPVRRLGGEINNESWLPARDVTFEHWAVYQLKRWPFVTIQPIAAGEAVADEEVGDVRMSPANFLDLFSEVLAYYYGDAITMDVNPSLAFSDEVAAVPISHALVWDVLLKVYDITGARWAIEPRSDNDNSALKGERYVIKVGYPASEITHVFESGFEGGLLDINGTVQSDEIRNMIKGRGGQKNIPKYYFKKSPDESKWRSDPDWIMELKNIYFPNLMPATFRSYVQGWKAAHINALDSDGKRLYAGYAAVGEANAYAPWAYRKGFTDTKFRAVEFVADSIVLTPQEGDRTVEIMPGYSPYVAKGSSLDLYGPLQKSLDNNEEIYPSLQGTGMDVAVDIEQIATDGMEGEADANSVIDAPPPASASANVPWAQARQIVMESDYFHIPEGCTANLELRVKISSVIDGGVLHDRDLETYAIISGTPIIKVFDSEHNEHSVLDIPAGKWFYQVVATVENLSLDSALTATVCSYDERLLLSDASAKIPNTFDIWVKNIFGDERRTITDGGKVRLENDTEFSHRVWDPILGDGNSEAKVVFTSGNLAVSEDYEFVIAGVPTPDQSKTLEGETSFWRIPLYRCDADYESLNVYVPNTKRQGNAGDTFVFVGTELTHWYVTEAEKRVDENKKDHLAEVCDIKPSFRVTADRVWAGTEGRLIAEQIKEGAVVELGAKRLSGENAGKYHIQQLTITYREPTDEDAALNPDIEMVLGEDYGSSSGGTLTELSGQVEALNRQIGSISNVEQIVRKVCDRIYLRKDGLEDLSLSPTRFLSLLTSGDFRQGFVGGAGWGLYRNSENSWTMEVDDLYVRHNLAVNNLVINQIAAFGGTRIESAAIMEVSHVVDAGDTYRCHFDQKSGTVANCFAVGDVACSQRFNADNTSSKSYKCKVVDVGADYISLSKTVKSGGGEPQAGDVIVHYGSYTDADRRHVIVRDVIGGGYERFIENLDSVDAIGREYYFIGRQKSVDSGKPRFYLGDEDAYIEYRNGKLTICGELSVNSKIGDKGIDAYIKSFSGDAVVDFKVLFKRTTSATEPPDLPTLKSDGTIDNFNGWSGTAPSWVADNYIWQTTYSLQNNGTGIFSQQVCISGRDGKGIRAIVTEYYLSTSSQTAQGGAWDVVYPSRTAGTYIWMRSHIIYSDGTSEYVGEACISGENGANGMDAVVLDIENELMPLACEPDGSPLAGQLPFSTVARVYKGNGIDSGWAFGCTSNNCVATINESGTITVSSITSSEDAASVVITATKSPAVLTATLQIPFVKKGQASVLYTILPSASVVTRKADGTLSAATLTFTKQKTVGNTPTVATSEKILFIRQDGVDSDYARQPDGESATIAVNTKAVGVDVELRDTDGTTVLDRERVPVLTDATGMAIGGENILRNSDYLDGELFWVSNFPEEGNVWVLPPDNTLGTFQGRKTLGVSYLGASNTQTWRSVQQYLHGKLRAGGIYTLSGWIYIPSLEDIDATLYIRMQWAAMREEIFNLKTVTPAGWRYVSAQITVPADYTNNDSVRLMWQLEKHGEFYLNGWKLEEGNVATAWSASSEDISYLRTALRENTDIDGGLIAATLIRLGYTDVDGERRTTAGLNGVISASGRDTALWAGGEMDSPTTALRHDGTAFFCENTVRMEKDRMEVGDNVTLDTQGLKMLGADGQLRFALTNAEIVDFDALTATVIDRGSSTPVVETFTINKAPNNPIFFITQPYARLFSFGTLKKNSSIAVNLAFELPFAITYGDSFLNNISVGMYCNGVRRVERIVTFEVRDGGVYAAANLVLDVPEESSVNIEVDIPGTAYNGGSGQVLGSSTASVKVFCRATQGTLNSVMSGNNGFVAVWGSTALYCSASEAALVSGNYGLRVTPDGIKVRDATSGKWRDAII